MAANFLEQLIAEWYEYQGYFVRRNVMVGRRKKGGYEGELDVVAFHPHEKRLVHLESSMDADSWAEREARYLKKFEAGRRYIPDIFKGSELPEKIDQIAVLVSASKATHKMLGGGRIVLMGELLEDIFGKLKDKKLGKAAIPEHLTVLRSFQFVAEYRDNVFKALEIKG